MFTVYIIQLPVPYNPNVLAFSTEEKAQQVCDELKADMGEIHYSPMTVLENESITIEFKRDIK